MLGLRRQGRAFALQLLYQMDITDRNDPQARERFWAYSHASKKARAFGEQLVEGVLENQGEIDNRLSHALEKWKLKRLPLMVRNMLRLGVCELIIIAKEPHPVIINEALELLRMYMDEESARFANSVLEKVRLGSNDPLPPLPESNPIPEGAQVVSRQDEPDEDSEAEKSEAEAAPSTAMPSTATPSDTAETSAPPVKAPRRRVIKGGVVAAELPPDDYEGPEVSKGSEGEIDKEGDDKPEN